MQGKEHFKQNTSSWKDLGEEMSLAYLSNIGVSGAIWKACNKIGVEVREEINTALKTQWQT
jgi:hypothetical protein